MATATEVKILEARKFVAVNTADNNNKFWQYEHLSAPVTETNNKGKSETGDTRITWGRVGAAHPDQQLIMWDVKTIAGKIASKTDIDTKEVYSRIAAGQGLDGLRRKGKRDDYYTEVKTMGHTSPPTVAKVTGLALSNESIKKAAVTEIAGGCAITAQLVKKLAETNKHELVAATGGLSKGGMDIDLETGLVRTALGVVTLDAIKEARQVLDRMLPYIKRNDTDNLKYYGSDGLLSTYLRLVPQDVGSRRRGWHSDFINISAQTSLLDQLETSVELAEQRVTDASKIPDGVKKTQAAPMFECKLTLVSDTAIWKRLNNAFFGTKNSAHRLVSNLKPVKAWEVTIPHHVRDFEAHGRKVGNIKELWHGSRVVNILSLLKRGYILPGQLSSAQLCGAMFGPYLYYSDQSSKSLNYARGGVWSSGVDNVCYMFYNDVAMGREYIPRSSCSRIPAGYDSIFAKAGQSGVMNNEMVIPHTHQVNPRYLIEFS